MLKILKIFFLMVVVCLASGYRSRAQVYDPPRKKLIDFGWNSPYVSDFRANMKFYENGPFDGITLKLSKEVCSGNVFMIDDWAKTGAEAKEAEKRVILSLEKSNILTDNFIAIFGGSQMDWFSDKDWALAEDQIRFAARLARAAKCKGVVWDPEPYKPGKNPWK